MKKFFITLTFIAGIALAFTSCRKEYYCVSNLTGIYTSASSVDTSTVILAPQGQNDMIMVQVLNDGKRDSICITPMVMIDNCNNTGNFTDAESGWQGDFIFSNDGESAELTMVNQVTGEQLPIIYLIRTQFGNTLAGSWADPSDPQKNNMSITLSSLGIPDFGNIKINNTDYPVTVYGPNSKYGNGTMYINSLGWATFQLSAMTSSYTQSILISINGSSETLEMERIIGE